MPPRLKMSKHESIHTQQHIRISVLMFASIRLLACVSGRTCVCLAFVSESCTYVFDPFWTLSDRVRVFLRVAFALRVCLCEASIDSYSNMVDSQTVQCKIKNTDMSTPCLPGGVPLMVAAHRLSECEHQCPTSDEPPEPKAQGPVCAAWGRMT